MTMYPYTTTNRVTAAQSGALTVWATGPKTRVTKSAVTSSVTFSTVVGRPTVSPLPGRRVTLPHAIIEKLLARHVSGDPDLGRALLKLRDAPGFLLLRYRRNLPARRELEPVVLLDEHL